MEMCYYRDEMIESKDLPTYIREIERLNPHVIHSGLVEGSEFSTHGYQTTTSYIIDDAGVHEEFGHEDNFAKFLLEVGRRLQGQVPGQVLNQLFPPGKKVCDISEAVRRNIGMCLEKATIVSLRNGAILVKGLIGAPGYGRTFHAFNLKESDGGVVLIDAQNPIIANGPAGKVYHPFCFPLKGYEESDKRFVFEDGFEENIPWKYQLPLNIKTAPGCSLELE